MAHSPITILTLFNRDQESQIVSRSFISRAMADYGRGLRVFLLLDMTKRRLPNTFARTGICHARKCFSRPE